MFAYALRGMMGGGKQAIAAIPTYRYRTINAFSSKLSTQYVDGFVNGWPLHGCWSGSSQTHAI